MFSILGASFAAKKVIIDQDCSGPSTTNTNSVLALLLAPDIEVLAVTVPSGDAWATEELVHCYNVVRMLGQEHKVPVISGALFPLVHTREEAAVQFPEVDAPWPGAFGFEFRRQPDPKNYPESGHSIPDDVPSFNFAYNEAAAFMIDQVHRFPGQVSILELAPPTNLASAISMAGDDFTRNVDELWMMAGSVNCSANPTNDTHVLCDSLAHPRHEFNLWFDAEASLSVLAARWGGDGLIRFVPADLGFVPLWYDTRVAAVYTSQAPAAQYIQTCQSAFEGDFAMCDEFVAVAWLLAARLGGPEVVLKGDRRPVSVNTVHGDGYGDILVGDEVRSESEVKPNREVLFFTVIAEDGLQLFYDTFTSLILSSSHREGVVPMICSDGSVLDDRTHAVAI